MKTEGHLKVATGSFSGGLALLFAIMVGGCQTTYHCGVGFASEIKPSRGWLRVDMGCIDYPKYGDITVDSTFCEAATWYGKYRDFARDSSKSYWSLSLYHTDKALPDSKLLVDSVTVKYGEPSLEITVVPLCNNTRALGYNQVLSISPIPLPKDYVGPVVVRFTLAIVSVTGEVLFEKQRVAVDGGCHRQTEASEALRR
ncbi:MAG: hypothetical protein WAU88_03910 [Candidatus Zixiibacteriota bacterium]